MCMLSLFSKEMLDYYIRCFIQCLVVNFGVCFPRDPAPFVSKYVLHIHTTYQSGILGQRGGDGGVGGRGEQGQPSENGS